MFYVLFLLLYFVFLLLALFLFNATKRKETIRGQRCQSEDTRPITLLSDEQKVTQLLIKWNVFKASKENRMKCPSRPHLLHKERMYQYEPQPYIYGGMHTVGEKGPQRLTRLQMFRVSAPALATMFRYPRVRDTGSQSRRENSMLNVPSPPW